jgi:2-octaprenyl-3-methyl-6-methoxy-1,4-benzoquinol hydroxylase/2-octaprenylphenol hydroxylase
MTRARTHDVAIVGAGVVGAALALALARARFDVALIETRAPEAFDPARHDLRVYALSPASAAVLERLDVWGDVVAARVSPYATMRVWVDGPDAELRFDAALVGESQLGYIVEDSLLRAVLWRALERTRGVTLHCPARAQSLDREGRAARLVLEDGREIVARLLVAADGAHSPLRELAGLATAGQSYGQRALVANVETERPHEATAWQRFTPDGPLAFLPLADGRCSIVWSLKDARATEMLALDDAAFRAALGRAFGMRLGAVTATGPRAAFPLRLLLAERYVDHRIALVGDAAHVVLPLAGQGLNLGLLDTAALADVLDGAAAAREDVGDAAVLARYERWRRGEAALAARSFDLLDGLFRSDAPGIPWLRRSGLALVDRLTPLKREFALAACGFAGRVPTLAQRLR